MATRATEADRGEWADVLQEETMQSLAAVRLLLDAGLGTESPELLERAASDAVCQLDAEIVRLRGLVTEIRTASS